MLFKLFPCIYIVQANETKYFNKKKIPKSTEQIEIVFLK